VSRSLWRCRNPACPVPHGAVLGQVTEGKLGLVLDPAVRRFRAYLDTRKTEVVCHECGTTRTFRGSAVFSEREPRDARPACNREEDCRQS
jgi:hypothetical protein